MISLTYSCASCGWKSGALQEAQEHANTHLGHVVRVSGSITSNVVVSQASTTLDDRLRQKAREREILRRAREKGLV